MAFTLPAFPITCNIFTGPWLTKSLRIGGQACNLAYGRRVHESFFSEGLLGAFGINAQMQLLVPPLVDLRAVPTYPVSDIIEVPAGSGRWYVAVFVDDSGKGFGNEHRVCELAQLSPAIDSVLYAGSQWPTPMP